MDASVIVAYLNPGDLNHHAATEVLLEGAPGQLLVHTITLAEVLVGGVRIGQGASMRDDLRTAGITVAPQDVAWLFTCECSGAMLRQPFRFLVNA